MASNFNDSFFSDTNKLDPNEIIYVQQGVFYHPDTNEPHYYVEWVQDPNSEDLVYVFDVEKGTGVNGIKAKKARKWIDTHQPSPYSEETPLAKYAKDTKPVNHIKKEVVLPPRFWSAVMLGKSTFTGNLGTGFLEKSRLRESQLAGKKEVVAGKETGVFITLDEVEMYGRPTPARGSIVQALTNQENSNWFDLE